jgi:polysaccharide chain length determinant protein (PEP-CTERM system associated)
MDLIQRQLVNKYLDLFFRRKLLIFSLFIFSMPLGLAWYFLTPKVYQATSLLSYEQQKINPNKMSPDIVSQVRDIVSSLTQIVTSRTNLEKLIIDLNLYPDARKKKPMEDVVEGMRNNIKIEPSKQGDIFKITFTYGRQDQVVKVTNALASKFIEENLKYREEKATETSSYTSDELRMAKETMDKKESAMAEYKLKHYNEMPEQRDANVGRLIALQKQYQDKQTSIQDLERTCVLIQDQINNRKKVIESVIVDNKSEADPSGQIANQSQPLTNEARLIKAKRQLDLLLGKYTEKHPEVKRTRELIATLESEVAKETSADASQQKTGGGSGSLKFNIDTKKTVDPVILQLETQLKSVLINIENIKAEREQEKKVITKYEEWLAATPNREAEWANLTREYAQLKRHYDYLVSQDLEAKSMLNLEKRQKGSQFKIEDPARTPEKPIKPDFIRIMAIAVATGIGLAAGISLFVDFFDSSYRDPEALENSLGIPLLTTVPYLPVRKEEVKTRWGTVLQALYFVCSTVGVGVLFAVAWFKGYIVI